MRNNVIMHFSYQERKGNASASDPNESPSMIASLTQSLTKGEYECMVCMDRIGRKAQVRELPEEWNNEATTTHRELENSCGVC